MGNLICITISVGMPGRIWLLQVFCVVGLWTGEGGGENFQLSSTLGNLPKTSFATGASFEMGMAEVRENAPPV